MIKLLVIFFVTLVFLGVVVKVALAEPSNGHAQQVQNMMQQQQIPNDTSGEIVMPFGSAARLLNVWEIYPSPKWISIADKSLDMELGKSKIKTQRMVRMYYLHFIPQRGSNRQGD
jgi:hypothetical protein